MDALETKRGRRVSRSPLRTLDCVDRVNHVIKKPSQHSTTLTNSLVSFDFGLSSMLQRTEFPELDEILFPKKGCVNKKNEKMKKYFFIYFPMQNSLKITSKRSSL